MNRQPSVGQRLAFTLIELLVVIAIIAILVALTTGVVIRVLRKGPEVQNKVTIDQLNTSVTNFKTTYGFYPPSRIRLCRFRGDYGSSNYELDSLSYIMTMWPDIDLPTWINAGIAWDGGRDGGTRFWDLEGDQCLVFFLGGIPGGPDSVLGFSTSRTNPTQAGGDRKTLYNFESIRLYVRVPSGASASYPFLSYKDAYETTPYVYFSSGKRANGYNPDYSPFYPAPSLRIPALMVEPYYEPSGKYLYPDTFQIISAGEDGQFGGGGPWTASNASNSNLPTQDNQANFHPYKLGVMGN